MKARSRSARIAAQLADLKMPGALEALDEVLAGVDSGGATAAEAIELLLAAQITLRNSRRLATAMRSSRLPAIKTLADFDFSFQPSVKREQIDSLHELGFLERAGPRGRRSARREAPRARDADVCRSRRARRGAEAVRLAQPEAGP